MYSIYSVDTIHNGNGISRRRQRWVKARSASRSDKMLSKGRGWAGSSLLLDPIHGELTLSYQVSAKARSYWLTGGDNTNGSVKKRGNAKASREEDHVPHQHAKTLFFLSACSASLHVRTSNTLTTCLQLFRTRSDIFCLSTSWTDLFGFGPIT
jgi:hypothetical protein